MAIQILPARETFGSAFGAGLGGGISKGFSEAIQLKRASKAQEQENKAIEDTYGINLGGIRDPKARQSIITETLKGQRREKELEDLGKLLRKGKDVSEVDEKNKDEPTLTENLSQEDLAELEIRRPGLGKTLQSLQEAEEKKEATKVAEERRKFESDRTYHAKRADPIIEKANTILQEAPIKQGLLEQVRKDIRSGKLSGIWPMLADKTGLEFYRSPEAARFKTAVKERFVSGVKQLGGGGARPNMFIERQLSEALPALGRSEESNESVVDLEEFMDDMKLQRAKLELQMAQEDRDKYGYPREDIAERADRLMADYAEKRQEKMAYDIHRRNVDSFKTDQELSTAMFNSENMYGAPITRREVEILLIKNNNNKEKAYQEAKRMGYTFPSQEIYSGRI